MRIPELEWDQELSQEEIVEAAKNKAKETKEANYRTFISYVSALPETTEMHAVSPSADNRSTIYFALDTQQRLLFSLQEHSGNSDSTLNIPHYFQYFYEPPQNQDPTNSSISGYLRVPMDETLKGEMPELHIFSKIDNNLIGATYYPEEFSDPKYKRTTNFFAHPMPSDSWILRSEFGKTVLHEPIEGKIQLPTFHQILNNLQQYKGTPEPLKAHHSFGYAEQVDANLAQIIIPDKNIGAMYVPASVKLDRGLIVR